MFAKMAGSTKFDQRMRYYFVRILENEIFKLFKFNLASVAQSLN